VPAGGEDLLHHLVGRIALRLGMLADEFAKLVVADLDAGLVGNGVEGELPGDRLRRLRAQALLQLLRRLARSGQVGLWRDPAALEGPDETGEELAGTRLDELARRLDVRRIDERVDCGWASSSICAPILCSRSVRSSSSVSNSLAARASSSSSGGRIFSFTSLSAISTVPRSPSASSTSTCFVSPADMPRIASSISSSTRPAPSSTT
jgi:hypothetical protein